MSAVFKVMQQMQRTQPKRVRGNRPVMIVLGVIVIAGMLMLVSELSETGTTAKSDGGAETSHYPDIELATSDASGWHTHGPTLYLTISLNAQNQWEVADRGVVSETELREVFMEQRALADEQGAQTVVRARIAGDEPAKRFIELHRMADECGMDHISVATQNPLKEDS